MVNKGQQNITFAKENIFSISVRSNIYSFCLAVVLKYLFWILFYFSLQT